MPEVLDEMTRFFRDREKESRAQSDRSLRMHNYISLVRVAVFIIGISLIVYLANIRAGWPFYAVTALFIGIFAYLILLHRKIAYKRNFFHYLAKVNEAEQMRLDGRLAAVPVEGKEFVDMQHINAFDLDLFGKGSIFQLLNRTVTAKGHDRLAQWLLHPADTPEILARQKALQELGTAEMTNFRQDFQAKGMFYPTNKESLDRLLSWVHQPPRILNKPLLVGAGYVLPIVMIGALIAFFLYDLPHATWGIPLLINMLALSQSAKPVTRMSMETDKNAKTLKTFVRLLKQLEEHHFQSEKLESVRASLTDQGGLMASQAIKQLSRILEFLEARQNLYFYAVANLLFVQEIFWAAKLERWQKEHREELEKWLDALACYDALNSMAGFAFAHPDYAWPELSESPFTFEGQALGHPLIREQNRVCNDFSMQGQGHAILITGSNMSGKSTFLRTLGVNAVLAFAGAPVCAQHLRLSPFLVFTSMRTMDSLQDNTSGFYAELKRIRQLLDTVNKGSEVFFLLDEVLKGTNSHDRYEGVKAVLQKLLEMPCFGLLSTHDLELTRMAEKLSEKVENYSFNSSIVNDQLQFHYRLEKGVCHSYSASKLMERLGITG